MCSSNKNKVDRVITGVHCGSGTYPICSMLEHITFDPKFIVIKFTAGNIETTFYVKSKEECLAFKKQVDKTFENLIIRLRAKEETPEDEENSL